MIKDRLKEYLSFKHLSVREFERMCGLANGVASRLSETTSPTTLRKIEKSSDISIDWLIKGDGEMLNKTYLVDEIGIPTQEDLKRLKKDIEDGKVRMIPLVNIDSVGGIHSENQLASSEQYIMRMIPFPDAREGDVAILQSGDSMSPVIPSGAILQLRRVEGWREYFGYGNVYVLWLRDDRRITKLVKRYDEDPRNYVMCCSYNPDSADEELPRTMIREVWQVVSILVNKGW